MKTSILILLLAAATLQTEYEKTGNVLILTDDNINDAIKEHEHLFVKFYAPWCPHCKKLAPKWEKYAEQHATKGTNVAFASLDAEKHSKAGEQFRVIFSIFF